MSTQDFDAITTNKPLKGLTVAKEVLVARNNQGRITTRHRGLAQNDATGIMKL